MQNFLANAGGLLNRLTGGANQLGLGALMYGSSQAQQGLKNMFGMPTTGDYIRQWEAQRTTPMQRAKVGQPMVLGGRLGYKSKYGWLPRGDMESENIPQYLPGSPQADKSGYVWDAARQQALGQPGGAIGRKNPLMEEFFGYQTGMSPQQMQEMQATAAPVPVAPGEIPYQQGDLGTRATLETGYDPAQYGLSPNLVEEMKKRLLQQAGK
jgi:hypothetical protein